MTDAQKPNLRSALADAQAKVKGLVFKAGANTEQRYRFVGHEDVIEHVRAIMVACGIIVMPTSLRFLQELRWPTSAKERVAWLWEQTFEIAHANSDERFTTSVQVTTMPNDKASFVASTAADRTLLMRLMRLAGTSEENPEDDSHDEGHRQQNGGARPGLQSQHQRAGGNGGQQRAQNTNAAGRVVQQLVADLNQAPADRETLANFYEYARGELAQCGATEQQKLVVQEAFGKRCAAAGLKPREVISGEGGMISTDLEIDAYLASKRASHHKLRTLATKGARGYYIAHEQRGHTAEDTKAYLVGRAFEDALQRPGEYTSKYIAKPEGMKFNTKEGKAWEAEQEGKGLSIVVSEDARAIEALLGTLGSCPTAQRLIADATAQVTIYHEDAVRGRWDIPGIQSRPDWLCLEGSAASGWRPYAYDLKTTKSLHDLCSGRAIVKYGYNRQAAMVRMCLEYEGVDVRDFRYLLLGAEKAFPHRWGVIEVPTQLIDVGQRWCEAQLDRLAEHYATGEWPLVESEVLVADVPAWLDESEAA